MKPISSLFLLLMSLMLILAGCEEETYEFGEPFSKITGITGSFVLTKVVQVDERTTALDNTFDISEFFIGSEPAKLSFNGSDFSYSLQSGTAPNFLGDTLGSWKFDDNDFPTEISLGTSNPTVLKLNRTIREIDQTLEFSVTRSCSGTAGVSYQYVFTRE
ncbi:MAG: DUF5004 domain-containing protein [Bacteroidota bacterium]